MNTTQERLFEGRILEMLDGTKQHGDEIPTIKLNPLYNPEAISKNKIHNVHLALDLISRFLRDRSQRLGHIISAVEFAEHSELPIELAIGLIKLASPLSKTARWFGKPIPTSIFAQEYLPRAIAELRRAAPNPEDEHTPRLSLLKLASRLDVPERIAKGIELIAYWQDLTSSPKPGVDRQVRHADRKKPSKEKGGFDRLEALAASSLERDEVKEIIEILTLAKTVKPPDSQKFVDNMNAAIERHGIAIQIDSTGQVCRKLRVNRGTIEFQPTTGGAVGFKSLAFTVVAYVRPYQRSSE